MTVTASQIRAELHTRGLSQADAARATQQSQSLVSMVLSGRAVSQPCLDKIAAWLRGIQSQAGGEPG